MDMKKCVPQAVKAQASQRVHFILLLTLRCNEKHPRG